MINQHTKKIIKQAAMDRFLEDIAKIPKSEFFNYSDMWKNPDIKKTFNYLPNSYLFDSLYEVPSLNFRYVYFFVDDDNTPHLPQILNPLQIKEEVQKNGYIFSFDRNVAIFGIPESQFKQPYISRFENVSEDF